MEGKLWATTDLWTLKQSCFLEAIHIAQNSARDKLGSTVMCSKPCWFLLPKEAAVRGHGLCSENRTLQSHTTALYFTVCCAYYPPLLRRYCKISFSHKLIFLVNFDQWSVILSCTATFSSFFLLHSLKNSQGQIGFILYAFLLFLDYLFWQEGIIPSYGNWHRKHIQLFLMSQRTYFIKKSW